MVMISVHYQLLERRVIALEISIYRLSFKVTCLISAIVVENEQLGDFVTGRHLLPVTSKVVKLPIPQID